MEQMCYNCKRATLVIHWSGAQVCASCGKEYDNVPDLQARETSKRVRNTDKEG